MNSTGHFYCSFLKSLIRFLGVIWAVIVPSFKLGFCCFGVAEILGIIEEILDERK